MSIVTNRDVSQKTKTLANSVDPDETARYGPSHQDLHCLHRYLFWFNAENDSGPFEQMTNIMTFFFSVP